MGYGIFMNIYECYLFKSLVVDDLVDYAGVFSIDFRSCF